MRLGDEACSECSELMEVWMPETLEALGRFCFRGSSITGLDLSMTQMLIVGRDSMCHCYELREVLFPACLVEVGSNAFEWSSITRLDFSETRLRSFCRAKLVAGVQV
jgi:hypothetical protein